MAKWKVEFSDLELEEKIGHGNFGEVWKGKYLGLDVAIKKLFFVDDDFMQKYIEREMDTLRGLNHPNIVQLMGLCTETGDIYIVTEFISGGNLRQTLKNSEIDLPWERRIGYAKDVALAMTYLHHKGIMHRDLKSGNLLIANDQKLKVCDFGLARNSPEEGEKYITTVGTNEWMAPEVALQDPYGPPADVFSYGMVLYELITRKKPPTRKPTNGYAFDAGLKTTIPPDTPPGLWELLLDCAKQDPEERPTFPDILKRLKDLSDSLTVGKSPSSKKSKSDGSGTPASSSEVVPEVEDEDESSEENHTSYIDSGREIAEVSKILKKPFRKSQFCKVECSIPKKTAWPVGSELHIKVQLENQSGKVVKVCRACIKTEGGAMGKKGKVLSKYETFKDLKGFPVKTGQSWEGQLHYKLPDVPTSEGNKFEIAVEFTLAGGLGSTKACAYLPICIGESDD